MNSIQVMLNNNEIESRMELANKFKDFEAYGEQNKIFIYCVENINNVILDEITRIVFKETQINDDAKFIRVDDEEDLVNCIENQVDEDNCTIFILDPDIIFEDPFKAFLNIDKEHVEYMKNNNFNILYNYKVGNNNE